MRKSAREEGQVLVITALVSIIMVAFLGIALDVGRMFVARAELSRSVDAAALAGVVELPDLADATSKVYAYMTENEPTATVPAPTSPGSNQLRVSANKTVKFYFLSLLGIDQATVSAKATAGFGIQPVDAYMAIDATSSMNDGCNGNQNNSGCPIYEAKNAAKAFTDVLLGTSSSGYTKVAAGAFRGCYNAPRNWTACVRLSPLSNPGVFPLTTSATTLKNQITTLGTTAGSGTNVCLGLYMANQVIFGAGSQTASNTRRFVVLLSDGDNVYNQNTYVTSPSPGSPPSSCRPSGPNQDNGYTSGGCGTNPSGNKGVQIDTQAYNLASSLKSQNVEIYVVGFGVCPYAADSTAACQTDWIGDTSSSSSSSHYTHDNRADRNLLKCIASSTSGTNDHYFEVQTASQLPTVFTAIAQQIAHRLIE